MNPLAIDAETYTPNDTPEICAALETFLERARRGEVRSFAGVAIFTNDAWHSESHAEATDALQLTGALEIVILRLPCSEDEI